MSDQNRVALEIRDYIAYVELNRPEKLNGLDYQMFKELAATAKRIRKDLSVRAVVMSGRGESFSAGLDFKAVSKDTMMVPKLFLKWPWRKTNLFQEVAHCWKALPVPVICAIHGNCFGGGVQIALAADYRIATADSSLSIMEMKWGLIPDMSGMVELSRLTREDIAKELTYTGRQFSGQEAFEYGLVSKLADDPLAEAETLAKVIAQQSPDAVAAAKHLIHKTAKVSAWKALLLERWVQMRLLMRKNQRIAMQNGLAKKGTEPKPFVNRSSFK